MQVEARYISLSGLLLIENDNIFIIYKFTVSNRKIFYVKFLFSFHRLSQKNKLLEFVI